jgi:hypothetical protein
LWWRGQLTSCLPGMGWGEWMNEHACTSGLSSFLFLFQLGPQPMGWCQWEQVSPTLLILFGNTLIDTEVCFAHLPGICQSMKVTTTMSHHSRCTDVDINYYCHWKLHHFTRDLAMCCTKHNGLSRASSFPDSQQPRITDLQVWTWVVTVM